MRGTTGSGPVALFLPTLVGGGAERVTVNLARGLSEVGHDVDMVVASAEGVFVDRLPNGVRLVELGAHRTAASLLPLARYLRRERPMALLSALNHANVIAVLASRVARFRGAVWVAEHNDMLPLDSLTPSLRAFRALMGWAYGRATGIVAVSHGVRESLERTLGLPQECVRVIYNPVIVPEMLELALEIPDHPFVRERSGPLVVGVGRLTRQKNFAHLLRAVAAIDGTPQARVLILGEGEERETLTDLAVDLGLEERVALPGFVPNPYSYLAQADVFVLSSDWEGLPTVLIEALAIGTPVVATNCPSGPLEILDDGAHGELVPIGDVNALARAIERVLAAERPSPDAAWLEQFTLAASVRRYAQVLGLSPQANAPRARQSRPASLADRDVPA